MKNYLIITFLVLFIGSCGDRYEHTGATGASGSQGSAGTNGNDGSNGIDGSQGPQGEPGADGEDGEDGDDAVTVIVSFSSTSCTSLGVGGFYGKAQSSSYKIYSNSSCSSTVFTLNNSNPLYWLSSRVLAVFVAPNQMRLIKF